MKNSLKVLSLAVLSLFLVTGCGDIPTLENGEEAVVTFKDDVKISVDALYNAMKENMALEQLVIMMDTLILETEFADYVEEAKEMASSYVDGTIESYGGEEALLEQIQAETSYTTIDAWENYIYLSYLQNHAAEKFVYNNLTEDQINKYYEDVAVGDAEIKHILLTPQVSSTATEDDIEEAVEETKEKLEDLIAELDQAKKDGEDLEEVFTKLAEEHSEDTATSSEGGDLGKINYGDLSIYYDELIKTAAELKDGAYSTEVIETELGYHIIFKVKSYEKESLEDLEEEIKEIMTDDTLYSDQTITFDALTHYRELYELDIIDDELNKQFNTYVKTIQSELDAIEAQANMQ